MNLKYCFYVLLLICSGCAKLIDIPEPVNSVTSEKVFGSDANANAAILGVYSQMSYNKGDDNFANFSISALTALSSDELGVFGYSSDYFQTNSLLENDGAVYGQLWSPLYSIIFASNAVIEGASFSDKVSSDVRQHLIGEAKFLRAFCYFYLVNLFGDVPLVITSSWEQTKNLSRTSANDVYSQIIKDLKEAQGLLKADYSLSTNAERTRATKWAAAALLARVYLFKGDWANAELEATQVIGNTDLFNLEDDLNNPYLKTSREAIWQLQVIDNYPWATKEANHFLPYDEFSNPNYYLTDQLVEAFEVNDNRKTNWTAIYTDTLVQPHKDYYYPAKFKLRQGNPGSVTEYYTPLRLAEQYLIRSEARAQQNKLAEAAEDVDMIRERAELPPLPTALSQADILNSIYRENRIEFFAEWGHRWLDLKRLGIADAVLSPSKGAQWQTTDQLYPIPQLELQRAHGLTQNDGY